jgi:cytochrome P450
MATTSMSYDELVPALFSEEGRRDPYPFLRAFHGPGADHKTASAVLHDRRFASARGPSDPRPLWAMFNRWLIALDGSEHARMRSLVAGPFARKLVGGYAQTIEAIVAELLDDLEARDGPDDLVEAVAYPLPVRVICNLLGVPRQDEPRFRGWLADLSMAFERQGEEVALATGDRTVRALTGYFAALLEERRSQPRDDLLTALAAAQHDIRAETVTANAIFLMMAGHETTMSAIGATVLLLLRHPDQRDLVTRNPALVTDAVEEAIRFESPVQIAVRIPAETVEVAGEVFPAGRALPILIGACNRDPKVFADPDTFDVTRSPNPHLGFVAGEHFCVGAPLARLEAPIAVCALLERFPRLQLAGEPQWRGSLPLRSLAHLPVTW